MKKPRKERNKRVLLAQLARAERKAGKNHPREAME